MNTEKNKYLAERMGVCWHDKRWSKEVKLYKCLHCEATHTVDEQPCSRPDYFTAEGRQVLLEWAVEQGWWYKFTHEYGCHGFQFPQDLLIPVSALADAVYEYLHGQ